MKKVLSLDPETSTYLFFEPDSVAEEFKRANQEYSHEETLDQLSQDQRALLIHTESGGGGMLHVLENEPFPEQMEQYVTTTHEFESFQVTGENLHVGGVPGYIHPDEFDLPPRSKTFQLSPGNYRICVRELDLDREYRRELIRGKISPRAVFLYEWLETVMIAVGLILLTCLASVFFVAWTTWFLVMLLIAVPAFLVPQFWCRSKGFQEAVRVAGKLEKECPDLIANFDRIDPSRSRFE